MVKQADKRIDWRRGLTTKNTQQEESLRQKIALFNKLKFGPLPHQGKCTCKLLDYDIVVAEYQ